MAGVQYTQLSVSSGSQTGSSTRWPASCNAANDALDTAIGSLLKLYNDWRKDYVAPPAGATPAVTVAP